MGDSEHDEFIFCLLYFGTKIFMWLASFSLTKFRHTITPVRAAYSMAERIFQRTSWMESFISSQCSGYEIKPIVPENVLLMMSSYDTKLK